MCVRGAFAGGDCRSPDARTNGRYLDQGPDHCDVGALEPTTRSAVSRARVFVSDHERRRRCRRSRSESAASSPDCFGPGKFGPALSSLRLQGLASVALLELGEPRAQLPSAGKPVSPGLAWVGRLLPPAPGLWLRRPARTGARRRRTQLPPWPPQGRRSARTAAIWSGRPRVAGQQRPGPGEERSTGLASRLPCVPPATRPPSTRSGEPDVQAQDRRARAPG